MSDSTVDCIYRRLHDGTSPDESVRSAEHVLSESLGGSFRLSKRFVCKACNNRLNSRVDMPMVGVFRGLLDLFRVQASKWGSRDNATSVIISADGVEMKARLLADGSLRPKVGPITKLEEELEKTDHFQRAVRTRRALVAVSSLAETVDTRSVDSLEPELTEILLGGAGEVALPTAPTGSF